MIQGMPGWSWGTDNGLASLVGNMPFSLQRTVTVVANEGQANSSSEIFHNVRLTTDTAGATTDLIFTNIAIVPAAGGNPVWTLADAFAGGGQATTITWMAAPVGSPTTTAINFTFSANPGSLITSDFTITSGTGSATVGTLSGSGLSRTLTVNNVNAGTVSVSINWPGSGIAIGPQTVTLVAPGQGPAGITITVTGIPSTYWWGEGDVSLWIPGTDIEVAFDIITVTGSSATFSLTAMPGIYDIYLVLEDWWGHTLYGIYSRSIGAGSNTIPFSSFQQLMWDLSADLEPLEQAPLDRSRLNEDGVQRMDPNRPRERIRPQP